jgi:hypothetical protein
MAYILCSVKSSGIIITSLGSLLLSIKIVYNLFMRK